MHLCELITKSLILLTMCRGMGSNWERNGSDREGKKGMERVGKQKQKRRRTGKEKGKRRKR